MWCNVAPAVLLILEALTRGVLPHHMQCGNGAYASAAGLTLREHMGDLLGRRRSSSSSTCSNILETLCISVLQCSTTSTAPQQQQHRPLLHLLSFAASLLKLPARPLKAVAELRYLKGCFNMAAAAQEVLRLQLQQQGILDTSLPQQRLVLAPWLALTGRCFLAAAQQLRSAQDTAPAGPQFLAECVCALHLCMQQLRQVLVCWSNGFSSSSSSDADKSSSSDSCAAAVVSPDPTAASAAGNDHAAVAAASAAATAAFGHLPTYSDLQDAGVGVLTVQLFGELHKLLLAAATRRLQLQLQQGGDTAAPSSSSGAVTARADGVASRTAESGAQAQHSVAAVVQTVARSITFEECWGYAAMSDTYKSALQELDRLGLLLCNQLPMPWLCNNPQCANLSGVSELQLVGGKACVCGGCRVAR
jgi:hypothetical protein